MKRNRHLNITVTTSALFCLANYTFALNPNEIAEKVMPSVVVIKCIDAKGQARFFGSGFFVADDIIASNLHVIDGATTVVVRPVNSTNEIAVKGFVALDKKNDLVLLKVNGHGKPLQIQEDSKVRIGDEIFVVGNPEGLEGTFSNGLISARREERENLLFQITAPISPGSSGGPVLSREAFVLGVTVAYLLEGQNLNFAIPSSRLIALLTNMKPVQALATTRLSPQPNLWWATSSLDKAFLNTTWSMSSNDVIRVTGLELSAPDLPPLFTPDLVDKKRIRAYAQKGCHHLWGYPVYVEYLFFDNMLYEYYVGFTIYDLKKSLTKIRGDLLARFGNPNPRDKVREDVEELLNWSIEKQKISFWVMPGIDKKSYHVGIRATYLPLESKIQDTVAQEKKAYF